jgi:hypothetical protein
VDLPSTRPKLNRQEIAPIHRIAIDRNRIDLRLSVPPRDDLAARDPTTRITAHYNNIVVSGGPLALNSQ